MSIRLIPIIQLQPRQPDQPCTHPALRSTGPGKWQCVICQQSLTDLELIDQRHERRAIRRQA